MKIIHGGLRSGKTHRLIEWAKEKSNRAIMVKTLAATNALKHTGLKPHQIHYFGESSKIRIGHEQMEFAVDDVDWVLNRMCSPHKPYNVYNE